MKNYNKGILFGIGLMLLGLIGVLWLYPQTIFANANLSPIKDIWYGFFLFLVTIVSFGSLIIGSLIIMSSLKFIHKIK